MKGQSTFQQALESAVEMQNSTQCEEEVNALEGRFWEEAIRKEALIRRGNYV